MVSVYKHPLHIVVPQKTHQQGNHHFGEEEVIAEVIAERVSYPGDGAQRFGQQVCTSRVEQYAAHPHEYIFDGNVKFLAFSRLESPFVIHYAIDNPSAHGAYKRCIHVIQVKLR